MQYMLRRPGDNRKKVTYGTYLRFSRGISYHLPLSVGNLALPVLKEQKYF